MQLPKRHRYRSPPGAAPGTLTIAPNAEKSRIDVLSFGPAVDLSSIRRQSIASIDDLPPLPQHHTIRWVNVSGLGDAATLQAVGHRFNIHPLALADATNTAQRPKVEPYEAYLFIVTRVPSSDRSVIRANGSQASDADDAGTDPGPLETDQVSICVGSDFVVTFQERAEDVFDPVRRRLMEGGRIQKQGADYLAYALLDAVIDSFFPLLETYGEGVDDLEANVIAQPTINRISGIHNLKRNLLTARRAVWPQREMLNTLIRDDTSFISATTKPYLRDCYDHVVQLIDMIETYREIASGLVDVLLSSQSNRMNEVMKVLTVIATIFIPLSWVASVYGMNFDTKNPWNLPELSWRFGYFYALGVMAVMACAMLVWFWRRGWIGRPSRKSETS